jgi:hypothetical protein
MPSTMRHKVGRLGPPIAALACAALITAALAPASGAPYLIGSAASGEGAGPGSETVLGEVQLPERVQSRRGERRQPHKGGLILGGEVALQPVRGLNELAHSHRNRDQTMTTGHGLAPPTPRRRHELQRAHP